MEPMTPQTWTPLSILSPTLGLCCCVDQLPAPPSRPPSLGSHPCCVREPPCAAGLHLGAPLICCPREETGSRRLLTGVLSDSDPTRKGSFETRPRGVDANKRRFRSTSQSRVHPTSRARHGAGGWRSTEQCSAPALWETNRTS